MAVALGIDLSVRVYDAGAEALEDAAQRNENPAGTFDGRWIRVAVSPFTVTDIPCAAATLPDSAIAARMTVTLEASCILAPLPADVLPRFAVRGYAELQRRQPSAQYLALPRLPRGEFPRMRHRALFERVAKMVGVTNGPGTQSTAYRRDWERLSLTFEYLDQADAGTRSRSPTSRQSFDHTTTAGGAAS